MSKQKLVPFNFKKKKILQPFALFHKNPITFEIPSYKNIEEVQNRMRVFDFLINLWYNKTIFFMHRSIDLNLVGEMDVWYTIRCCVSIVSIGRDIFKNRVSSSCDWFYGKTIINRLFIRLTFFWWGLWLH